MKRIGYLLTVLFGTMALEACTGGVSDQSANPPPSLGGIWKGQLTAASGSSLSTLMVVTEDGKFFSIADNTATGCADVVAGQLALGGYSYAGNASFGITRYATDIGVQIDCSFSDSSVWGTTALTGSVVSRKTLIVTADDITSLGTVLQATTGTLIFDDVYNESSSLGKISGNWTLSTGPVLTIDSAGAIYSQDPVNGCVVNGMASLIDSKYNAYAVSATYSNCGPSSFLLNGLTATGLMTLDDTQTPAVLYVGYSVTLLDNEVVMVAVNGTK